MRNIKFRGKRKDNGEWVYGYYVFSPKSTSISGTTLSEFDRDTHWIISRDRKYEVIPETVGQYTGLKDKDGHEIYEGDILRKELKDEVVHYLVDFGNWQYPSSFILIYKHPQVFLLKHADVLEIIGNIHDNPELWEK